MFRQCSTKNMHSTQEKNCFHQYLTMKCARPCSNQAKQFSTFSTTNEKLDRAGIKQVSVFRTTNYVHGHFQVLGQYLF